MSYGYFDQLPAPARARYRQKLDICALKMCPYRFPASVWQNNPSEWPEMTYIDIHEYLVDSPGEIFLVVTLNVCSSEMCPLFSK